MPETLVARLKHDEELARNFLEASVLRAGVLLGSILILAGIALLVVYESSR